MQSSFLKHSFEELAVPVSMLINPSINLAPVPEDCKSKAII